MQVNMGGKSSRLNTHIPHDKIQEWYITNVSKRGYTDAYLYHFGQSSVLHISTGHMCHMLV